MNGYNTNNYTDNEGATTHIGGELVIEKGGRLVLNEPLLAAVDASAPATDSVAKVRATLVDLVVALQAAGLMASK